MIGDVDLNATYTYDVIIIYCHKAHTHNNNNIDNISMCTVVAHRSPILYCDVSEYIIIYVKTYTCIIIIIII